jgi:hypothetical protein
MADASRDMHVTPVVALQTEISVSQEAVAETGVILRRIVNRYLTGRHELVLVTAMRTALVHAISRYSHRPPRIAHVRIITY